MTIRPADIKSDLLTFKGAIQELNPESKTIINTRLAMFRESLRPGKDPETWIIANIVLCELMLDMGDDDVPHLLQRAIAEINGEDDDEPEKVAVSISDLIDNREPDPEAS